MLQVLSVAVGGALGAVSRYLLNEAAGRMWGTTIPWGTLAVNGLGSFFLAAILEFFLITKLGTSPVRLLVTTGFMGAFTTYSTYNQEVLSFWRNGDWMMGGAYALGTLSACLILGVLGLLAARAIWG